MMKLDSKFFNDVKIRAMRTEFGAAGVLLVIELMTEMFESPHGYWRPWKLVDRVAFAGDHGLTVQQLDAMIKRMVDFEIVSPNKLASDILTSMFFELEFIRQCGVARYNRIREHHSCLYNDEQMELGAIPASTDCSIPIGQVIKLSYYEYPKTYRRYQKVRIKSRIKDLAIFKRTPIPPPE